MRGCDLRFAQLSPCAPVLPGICKHSQQIAPQTLRYGDTMRVIALLLLCFASRAPPRLKKALRSSACTCVLSPREQSSIPKGRARDSKHYRGTSGRHTLSVRSYSANDTPAPLARGARQPHGMKFGQSSLETHQLYQPYRAQVPTAMAT